MTPRRATRPDHLFLTMEESDAIAYAPLSLAARARALGVERQVLDRLVMRLHPVRPDVVARVRARLAAGVFAHLPPRPRRVRRRWR